MGNFNRGGGGGFGGNKRFDNDRGGFRGGDRSERPAMHQAICAECGKECSVPFKPTGNKPVFCSNCFGKKEGGSNSNSGRFDRRDSRPSFADKQMFKVNCDKCHKECEVPFKPSGDKPVFCNDCFVKGDKGAGRSGGSSVDYTKQFEMLSSKLDSLLKILDPNFKAEKVVKEVKAVAKLDKKIVAKPASAKASVGKKVVAKKKVAAPKKIVAKKKK
ncbi:MAG: hypothetical protein NTY12_02230 [Candidatus Falkowbacteria bacterium]|nr:hypothetical protein [Candidatus Falkowbacteria bacterium]